MHACNHQLVGQTSTNFLPTALTLQLQYLTVYVYHKANSTTVYTATITTQEKSGMNGMHKMGCKKKNGMQEKVNSIKHHIFYRPGQLCLEIMSLLLVANFIPWFCYCGKLFLSNKLSALIMMAESHLVVTVDKPAMVAKLDYRYSIQRDSVLVSKPWNYMLFYSLWNHY